MLGRRFERLTVIAPAEPQMRPNGKGRPCWLCRCDCGTETIVSDSDLKTGNTRSCGCLHTEIRKARLRTHGQRRTRTYYVWTQMKQRCFNPNDDKYADYGGRGIIVCDDWRDSYEAFLRDMGPKPEGMSIDRIENDGNYEPGNCRWASPLEQGANKRSNVIVEWRGERMILGEAIRREGLPRKPIEKRLKRGWSLERALTTPLIGR